MGHTMLIYIRLRRLYGRRSDPQRFHLFVLDLDYFAFLGLWALHNVSFLSRSDELPHGPMPRICCRCVYGLKGLLGSRRPKAYRLTPGRVKLDVLLALGAFTLTLVTYRPPLRWYVVVPLSDARNFDRAPAGTTVASVAVKSSSCVSSQILLTECRGLTTFAI